MTNNPDEQILPGPLQYVPPPPIEQIASSLAGIDIALQAMGERERWRIIAEREAADASRAARARAMSPRAVNPTWPWTSATTVQGFLANRWLRRDGNVYSAPSAAATAAVTNSPIAGGPDSGAKVYVPSGAPRAG